jgi:hypothetical protein
VIRRFAATQSTTKTKPRFGEAPSMTRISQGSKTVVEHHVHSTRPNLGMVSCTSCQLFRFTLLKHPLLEHAPVADFQDVFPIHSSLQGLYSHWLCCFAPSYSGRTLKIRGHSIFARTHWQSHSPNPQHIRVRALYCTVQCTSGYL